MTDVRLFTPDDVPGWMKAQGREIYLGDVVDGSDKDTMGVGFARYAPGESNHWVVTYDEVLVVTGGAFSVTPAGGQKRTAREGEILFLAKDTDLVYAAEDSGAELVYVMDPDWTDTQLASDHADLLETFQPIQGSPPRRGETGLALMKEVWGPLERGESHDFGPFFDALADDVVFSTPVGEIRGKDTLVSYFGHVAETMEFDPFQRPFEYYTDGDKVVIAGGEIFTIKDTGRTHQADWTWIVTLDAGRVTRILHIQNLAGVSHLVTDAIAKAQPA